MTTPAIPTLIMQGERARLAQVLLAVYLIFLTGCGSYRRVGIASGSADLGPEPGPLVVEPGTAVRLTLHSGETYVGTVASWTDEQVVLTGRGNYNHEDVTIRTADVDIVEVRQESDGFIEGNWFLGMLSALLISIMIWPPRIGG